MRTTYRKKQKQYEIRVCSRMRFSCQKKRKVMGFFGSVNGTTKIPGFWILVFANVNGPYNVLICALAL